MRACILTAVVSVAAGFGCTSKVESPADSPELREQQNKAQLQADAEERQYQKEQKKR